MEDKSGEFKQSPLEHIRTEAESLGPKNTIPGSTSTAQEKVAEKSKAGPLDNVSVSGL